MNAAARLKQDIIAMKERHAREYDELAERVDQLEAPADDSPWMKLSAYARLSGLSPKTISRYVDEANEKTPKGAEHPFAIGVGSRRVRVHRERLNAWRAQR